MKIFNGVELTDLAIYTNKTLIVTDFHIGYEEALNKQGLMVPRFQFQEIMSRLNSIFKKLKNKKIEKIIINGDLKHEFGAISAQEWRHTLKLLDYFGKHCREIILIKGNHDTILGPIAEKRNIHILQHYLISPMINESNKKYSIIEKYNTRKNCKAIFGVLEMQSISMKKLINGKNSIQNKNNVKIINKNKLKNKILVMHGNNLPNKELLKEVSTIIIGHEHPAVSLRKWPRSELFKAYLIGKWKSKNLIVQPSFNLVTEGTDVLKEELLSPFLKDNLGNFDVVIVADKMYRFGKLGGVKLI